MEERAALPILQGQVTHEADRKPRPSPPRILVIDDDPQVQKSLPLVFEMSKSP
jgi:hypothetical protein